jgi:cation diffusion facilitator family transporter
MSTAASKRVIFAALAGNLAIAITKTVAAALSGSAAMASEAIHSFVDTGNQVLLLIGLRQAARPADEEHPFGYGLSLYFWSFVVAMLVFGLGAGVSIWEGIDKTLHPHPIRHVWLTYTVLGVSILFEGSVWLVALREFNRTRGRRSWWQAIRTSKDSSLLAVLFEDTAALLGLLVALVGITLSQAFHLPRLDGIASIGIGLLLAGTATWLAVECQSLLTGESLRPAKRQQVCDLVLQEKGIERINELRSMHFGPHDVLVTLSLDFNDRISAGEVERIVTRLEVAITRDLPEITQVFIKAQSRADHDRLNDDEPEDFGVDNAEAIRAEEGALPVEESPDEPRPSIPAP